MSNQLTSKIAVPVILSSLFLAACTDSSQAELNTIQNDLDSTMKEIAQDTAKLHDTVLELGRTILTTHCVEEINKAIGQGQISLPVTIKAIRDAKIAIEITGNKNMPTDSAIEWVESLGPEYKVTNNKLDCSYVVGKLTSAPRPQ